MRKFCLIFSSFSQVGIILVIVSIMIVACTPAGSTSGSATAYLPTLQTLPLEPPLPEVTLRITPTGGLNASTFTPSSFQLTNNGANSQSITQVSIDLTTAILPDMVFDPDGLAGDTVAKDLTIDSDPGTGFISHSYSGFHDQGYDILSLAFSDFDPGETLTFSVDVDPTSIQGSPAPGPNESGSVSGLELAGATITVTFDDSTTMTGNLYRIANSNSGSEMILRTALPSAPTVEVLGVPNPPTSVGSANQIVRINAPAGHSVSVLVVEGGLFTAGLPGGGFDLDPFEANSAIQIREYNGVISRDGQADVPIVLSNSNASGGLNHILVILKNAYGMAGATAEPIILELTN